MVELPGEFHTSPLAYYVWSRSPRAAHIVAFAIAKLADPAFRWMSIRESSAAVSDEEAWVHRLLPASRILAPLVSTDLGKEPQVPKETFSSLFRAEGAGAERIALDHFLLLPQRLQGILEEPTASAGPRAIVVANTNRVRQFYPTDPDHLRAYTMVFPRSGISMITTSVPPPYKGRYAFDIVLRVDVASAEEWRDAHLVVEKGMRTGEFHTGATFPSSALAWYVGTGNAIEKALR